MRTTYLLSLLLILSACTKNIVPQDIYATTEAGTRVVLKGDSSWEYARSTPNLKTTKEQKEDKTKVDLRVVGKWDAGISCRIGLSLTNRKARFIRNLGIELTAYVQNDIEFETLIVGFYGIKPTKYQYREAIFNTPCKNIQHILVHGSDYCSVGEDLVKFSTTIGECLESINVEKSEIINIHK
ncbi:hypothetical protein [methanotrophic endosymbiont of Bathymodiolus puteoserpentis (Logatchev)]|jgi:hypothetical protein|uniref:hypothetical protein n=1 Tax=methanotrophic endosymbiont of Bathymodiolus puteoserpentis (Logatchev) TaxID=343235 RepID=UPI0013C5E202|nr:hypothetical protein [methanotrophic endosymbiont of Bathymodiolus puteoserpentis (Logatchev)]SHE23219.1 hypothetical protein BPUTEOMOX_1514 [methanotrophic endosymbiont of Bathymodiolus puteoserpentis (Logatchev)]